MLLRWGCRVKAKKETLKALRIKYAKTEEATKSLQVSPRRRRQRGRQHHRDVSSLAGDALDDVCCACLWVAPRRRKAS